MKKLFKHRPVLNPWLLACAVVLYGFGQRLDAQNLAAFPGAVGFGGAATGATTLSTSGTSHSGGTVYHVTNLNDSGAGSFRTGVGTGGNIVVFDVGGNIQNLSPVTVASNVTIAGQTAPGGIQVFGAETSFYGSSNIICRYMHFRDGTLDPNYPGSSSADSHTNAANLGNTNNVIMDHCSFEFAAYNNIDAAGAVNTTIQNCIFADPILEQQFNCHIETGPVTFIDNLWANSGGRNPLGKANLQFVNNIVYNWGYAMTTGNSSGTFDWDVINNYFITGPNTTNNNDDYYQVDSGEHAYATGNYEDTSKNGTLQGNTANTVGGATVEATPWSPTTATLPTLSAQAAFYNVVSNAGPLPHDQVDSQVVSQTLSLGTQGRRFNTQTDTGLGNDGYGTITGGSPLPDSDSSGMPDDWKAAVGISLTNPGISGSTSSTGYTYLENYLAWKALPNAWVAKNTTALPTSVTIDLSQYTNGFGVGSTFTISGITNGTVTPLTGTQPGTGDFIVTFTPTLNTSGLGGFSWSVNNGVTTLSSTCGVLISQSGPSQSVIWKGDGVNNYWDLSTQNWTAVTTGSAVAFSNEDRVTFTDGGSTSPAVNIDTDVSPGSIEVEGVSSNYALSGAGVIAGTGGLVMNGAGTLTIENSQANTFSGGMAVNSGTVILDQTPGSGQITVANGTALEINSPYVAGGNTLDLTGSCSVSGVNGANIGPVIGDGTLNLTGNGTRFDFRGSISSFTGSVNLGATSNSVRLYGCDGSASTTFNLGTGTGEIYPRNGNTGGVTTYPLGSLTGGANTVLGGAADSVAMVYSVGALNTSTTFAGAISGAGLSLTKVGTGTLTLTGASSNYTGTTTVSAGTLALANAGALGGITTLTLSPGTTLQLLGNTNNTIFAPGSVVETSTGSFTVNTYNFYVGNNGSGTGNTLILANVGQFLSANTVPTLNLTGANGYTLQLGSGSAGTGTLDFYNNTTLDSNTAGVTLSIPGGLTVNYPEAYTLSFGGAGNIVVGALVQSGTFALTPTINTSGTVTFTGANTYTGATTVQAGTLVYTGGLSAGGSITVGNTASTNATLDINSGASVTAAGLLAGGNASGPGAVYQTGGTLTLTNAAGLNNISLGNVASAYGYYSLSSGTLASNEIDVGGVFNASTGVMDISGGTFNDAGWITVARGGATSSGVLNITGGTVNLAASTGNIGMFWAGSSGAQAIMNIGGGAGAATVTQSTTTGYALQMADANVSGGLSEVNLLTNGKLQIGAITDGAASTTALLDFNGGTLKANLANATYLTSTNMRVYVYANGGAIDNNGVAITISDPFLAPTGNGANSNPTVTAGGSGYIGAPMVTATGAGGTGATAYATVSSGSVTGIIITNPGTGYTGPLGFTLTGGGGSGATIGTVAQTADTSGGMTFQGSGITTLTGSSTYTGSTTVSSGTLVVAGAVTGTKSLSVSSGAVFSLAGGSLSVSGSITNNGTFIVYGTSALAQTGSFVNNGVLVLMNGASQPANLVNDGTVLAEPAISSATSGTAAVGLGYSYLITASNSPASFNATGLPGWLSINSTTGIISGTATATGTFALGLSASNAEGTGTAALNLVVLSAYNYWASGYFTPSQSALSGITDTPEQDGIANGLKYLFDINPTRPMNATDLAGLPVVGTETISNVQYITLTYRRNPVAVGATVGVETSPDMQTWSTVTPDFTTNLSPDPATGDPMVELGVRTNGNTKTFIYLEVTIP